MIFSWGNGYNAVHVSTDQSEFNATGKDTICGAYDPGVIGTMPPKDRPLCARCFAVLMELKAIRDRKDDGQ